MSEDIHMEIWESENQVPNAAWYDWIDKVEELFGRDVDGDQVGDGYSLDGFYGLWKIGRTPQQAIAEISQQRF
jgi:hypothetical protein